MTTESGVPGAADSWLHVTRKRIEDELDRLLAKSALATLPNDDAGDALAEAIRYGALGAGKRLRPALAIAAAEAVGGSLDDAIPAAVAVELLHAYTLIHDDLPAMDDDDERRGRPTVHVKFGEAVAILAGDALLTLAFMPLATLGDRCADAIAVLTARAGPTQLLAGQARDIEAERTGRSLDFDELERIHRDKTGALFAAAAELGAISAGATKQQREQMAELGMALGLAFQHADDRLDDEHGGFRSIASARATELATRATELAAGFPGATENLRAMIACIALR